MRPSLPLTAALVGIAAAAVVAPAIVVTRPPAIPPAPRRPAALPPPRIVPQAELPPVEPVAFVDLPPEDARAFNATVPFSTDPNPAARPFRFPGGAEDRARATDCLAAAVLYEAGDDSSGERAVAQVVLNRLRHPAFPKTVCGVVFEGQERSTGCQFTFTCDGALARWKPSEAGWKRAREVATMALAGAVYRPVGYATHYHTDWVVPYWQSSLDKIAAVETHLFFRWSGWWGTPPAFNRHVLSGEPVVAQLAPISDAHRTGAALVEADAALAGVAVVAAHLPQALASDPDTFLVLLDTRQPPDSYRAMAQAACGERVHCKLLGWTEAKVMPTGATPTPEQTDAMDFSYLRDRSFAFERTLWNCTTFKRIEPRECMKRQMARAEWPEGTATPVKPPEILTGVRRTGAVGAPVPKQQLTPLPKSTSLPKTPAAE